MANHTPVVTVGGYDISKSLLLDLTKIRAPYDDIPLENAYTGKKLELDWKLHLVSDDSRIGYDGALFSTEIDGKPHYFIYHQGSNDIKDVPSIARLANGKPPQQTHEACAFTDKCMELIAARHPDEKVPVAQVGYSLGAAMAIIACHDDQPVITFEAPGMKKLVEAQGRDPQAVGSRVLEVLSPHANAVNAHEEHVGGIITAGKKFWKTDKASIGDFIQMTAQTHRIKNLGLALAEMDDFTPVPAKDAGRATEVFDGFREYLHDCIGTHPTIGERALSATATVMDTLWIDKLITKVAVMSADTIASRISAGLAEDDTKQQDYRRPVTHPDVEHAVAAPVPAQQQEAAPETPEPQRTSHVEKLVASREQAAVAERQM